jgi:hypothetical protein
MKTLWKNKVEFVGVEIDKREFELIAKILEQTTFNQRKEYLTKDEEMFFDEVLSDFTA